ncbi:uncharacterized protein N0V89_010089 [Didymosphaeria variabile]|uniref:Uncharacterized protein n=1 Tax=Didymosphaeria variabile TaxID=1932322 RepID=A0A9W8XGD2_9PLEO|nr:uncharacterized protein N0V89_010089 [Didymosphaeria variabile]KAJ4348711.1 hypothetical protein N0V89_010089 [Didymosphaeria variabile]
MPEPSSSRPLRWIESSSMASAENKEANSTDQNESKTRVRRQPRQRKGPPQLQFVTATDPSDFKGEKAKRSVRSQAMIQYRYQSTEQKKQNKKNQDTQVKRSRAQPVERVVPAGQNNDDDDVVLLPRHDSQSHADEWWISQGHDADVDASWTPYNAAMVPALLA